MEAVKRLRIAYPPDGEDAIRFDALETGQFLLPGYELAFLCQPMSFLNRAAKHGEHEITAISSVVYPHVARRYSILSVGARVGRGSGPVLISRGPHTLAELAGRPVGVAGIPTTGWFLLRCLRPEAVPIEMPSDRMVEAVAAGEVEAGVLDLEELLHYSQLGLHRVVDLGAEWCQRNGLPLPITLHVIRRDLGAPAMRRICAALRCALRDALEQSCEAPDHNCHGLRGAEGNCANLVVPMPANEDSLYLADDVRMGLRVLLAQAADMGLAEAVPPLDIVEASESIAAAPLHAA